MTALTSLQGVGFQAKLYDMARDAPAVTLDELVPRDMAPLRDIFTKSVVARTALPAGTVLSEAHLAMKKPGTGVPAGRMSEIVGRRLRRSLETDEQLRLEDLEQ